MSEAEVLDALRACFDPATGRDIVQAGLVASMQLEVDREAPGHGIAGVPMRSRLRLTLKPQGDEDWCALVGGQVANRLAGVPSLSRVDVVWEASLFQILA